MLLSAALILLWLPASDTAKPAVVISDAPSASKAVAESPNAPLTPIALPDAPIAKIEPGVSAVQPFPLSPLKPAVEHPVPTPRQQKLWYTFMAVSHGAAGFDAWSTKRAVSGNYGTESNPFLRPFAHSNAIYAATQVSPLVMDYLGRRMMTSSHPTLRRFWWVPQVAGASFSFGSGMHNYALTQ